MRILTILARHGTAKYPTSAQDICALMSVQFADCDQRLIIADNSLPLGFETKLAHAVDLIGASNTCWEFSAWDTAVAHVGSQLHDYDFVHLATSAFLQLYTRYLNEMTANALRSLGEHPAALGHIDAYDEPVELCGTFCQCWLRSSFIFLRPADLMALGPLAAIGRKDLAFSGDPANPFTSVSPLSKNYQDYLVAWLTGQKLPQCTRWHSAFNLDASSLDLFERKVLAIVSEQKLSNRLQAQGCVLVDAVWLGSALRAGFDTRKQRFPAWRVQLAERDYDRLLL